jgi:membrane-bound inhibitor of C-type lysozyme
MNRQLGAVRIIITIAAAVVLMGAGCFGKTQSSERTAPQPSFPPGVAAPTAVAVQNKESIRETPSPESVAEADYQCGGGKQIKANYYKGSAITTKPGEPPAPSGKVDLALSDGRRMSLPQTISASGARYATSDESIIFWSKGESAFITEGDIMTYVDCAERVWTLGNEQLDRAVLDFLLSRHELSWQTDAGGKNFCVFQNMAPENELFPHYLWVRCGEYMMEDGQLTELSGTSVPIKLDYPNELSYFDQDKFSLSIPRDGSLYDEDVKVIFPPEIWDRLHFESGPLNERIRRQAVENFVQK